MPRQNTPPADYPQAVLQQIEQLAQNIVIARKRRGESQAQWAKKLGISQPTMARIERGDPSVAMASYVMCMWLINPNTGLAELVAPQRDHGALEKEVAKVRAQRKPSASSKARPAASPDSAAIRAKSSECRETAPADLRPKLLASAIHDPRTEQLQALESAFSPKLQALLAFQNSPSGQRIKAASKIAEGLHALLDPTATKKP